LKLDVLIGLNVPTVGGAAFAGRLMPKVACEVGCGAESVVASCKSLNVPVLNEPLSAAGKICRR
jgi:hypothetical protein